MVSLKINQKFRLTKKNKCGKRLPQDGLSPPEKRDLFIFYFLLLLFDFMFFVFILFQYRAVIKISANFGYHDLRTRVRESIQRKRE